MKHDIIIIGGGLVGCAVARLLSAYDAKIALLERGADVAEGASKANSGIVHAGFDAKPGTLKAQLNVRGADMYEALCHELDVPFDRCGALVAAFDAAGRETLQTLLAYAAQNGVRDVRIIERTEVLAMEPCINAEVECALYAPTSGITSPYELAFALADHAAVNGVSFHFDTEVAEIQAQEQGFCLKTNRGDYFARMIVNCAGVDSARLHNFLSEKTLSIVPRKGEYYLLDREGLPPFTHTVFQTPTRMGKGVLVSPTVHGNVLLGPTAHDITDSSDVSTTADAMAEVLEKSKITWPTLNQSKVITTFAGIRAHAAHDDFVVGSVAGASGAYEAVGIESPGLTAAPAIAELLCALIVDENGLSPKPEWKPAQRREKPFSAMTDTERNEAIARDPEYGGIVCRCEQVTEAEVRAAIRRPIGSRTIDGIKRRTRAGMGRCQGGFCCPRVLEILAEELRLSPMEITKNGGRSVLLTGTLESAAKEADSQ